MPDGSTPPHGANPSRGALFALATALVLAVTVRFAGAGFSPWFDEYASIFFAGQPLSRLWSGWMLRETNPPLFYTLLRGWLAIAGPVGAAGLRVPSTIASLLGIPVCFVGIGRLYGWRPAAMAALMLALSAQQVLYAQQARCYSMVFLALGVSLFGLLDLARLRADRTGTMPWLLYAGGAIAAGYLHTTALLWPFIATTGLVLAAPAWRPFAGRRWLALLLVDGAILLSLSWWIWITWLQMQASNPNLSWLASMDLRTSLIILGKSSLLLHGWGFAALPLLVLALAGAVRTRTSVVTRVTVACWATTIALYVVVGLRQPIIVDRTVFWITLFPLVLAAAGLARIVDRRRFLLAAAATLLLLGANLAATRRHFMIEDWLGTVNQVARDPHAALVLGGEGDAYATAQACRMRLEGRDCPFTLLTIPLPGIAAWPVGTAPRAAATPDGRPALAPGTRLYFVSHSRIQPLLELQRAGMLTGATAPTTFLSGPYPPATARELATRARLRDGLLALPSR